MTINAIADLYQTMIKDIQIRLIMVIMQYVGKLGDEDSRPRSFFGEGVLDGLAELRLPRLDLDYLDFHLRFLSFPARAYPPLLLTV